MNLEKDLNFLIENIDLNNKEEPQGEFSPLEFPLFTVEEYKTEQEYHDFMKELISVIFIIIEGLIENKDIKYIKNVFIETIKHEEGETEIRVKGEVI